MLDPGADEVYRMGLEASWRWPAARTGRVRRSRPNGGPVKP